MQAVITSASRACSCGMSVRGRCGVLRTEAQIIFTGGSRSVTNVIVRKRSGARIQLRQASAGTHRAQPAT